MIYHPSFLDPKCHCHRAGLRDKPKRGLCYRSIIEDRCCPFECEQTVLGYFLLMDDGLDRIADLITADDFVWGCHKRLFKIIVEMIRCGKSRLADDGAALASLFGQRGGMPFDQYILQLVVNAPTPLTIREYAEMMRDAAIERTQLQEAA